MNFLPLQFIFFLAFVLLFGGVALWRWWKNPRNKTKRLLRATRRSNIAEVRDGETVKVVGELQYVGEPLRAPLSGRPCAYYEVRVKEHHGKNQWQTIVEMVDGGQFLLRDGTAKAIVKLGDPSTALVEDVELKSGFLHDPSPQALALLEEHGKSSTTFLGTNKTLKYFEGVFEQGESIAVYGEASWEADPDPDTVGEGYRDRPKRLRIVAPAGQTVLVSDDPEVTR